MVQRFLSVFQNVKKQVPSKFFYVIVVFAFVFQTLLITKVHFAKTLKLNSLLKARGNLMKRDETIAIVKGTKIYF